MKGTAKDGSKTLVFTPEQSRFFEVQSFGPSGNDEVTTSYHSLSADSLREQALGDWNVSIN